MPLASSDQLSSYPVGVVVPVRAGLRRVRAGVEKRGGKGPEACPWAATFVAALSNSSSKGAGR